jgi:hypothetical protein
MPSTEPARPHGMLELDQAIGPPPFANYRHPAATGLVVTCCGERSRYKPSSAPSDQRRLPPGSCGHSSERAGPTVHPPDRRLPGSQIGEVRCGGQRYSRPRSRSDLLGRRTDTAGARRARGPRLLNRTMQAMHRHGILPAVRLGLPDIGGCTNASEPPSVRRLAIRHAC